MVCDSKPSDILTLMNATHETKFTNRPRRFLEVSNVRSGNIKIKNGDDDALSKKLAKTETISAVFATIFPISKVKK
jgi:hypothetical protein